MHPCAYCLPGFETLKKFEFRNRGGPNDGLGRPQYVGSFAIVYAEHEVVFLQSDQADRASGTWIDIPLHMNPLMRANGGLQGHDRAGSAWGSERGRASPCAGLGIRSSRWAVIRGSGVRICPASIYPYSVSLLLRYSASLSFNSRVSRLSLALKARVRTARMAR